MKNYNLLFFYRFVIDKNSAQTDEEKQRERQRNEREIKHAELEAQHFKVKNKCLIEHKIASR